MTIRLIEVEIEDFRGFSRAQTIDLGADVVLIHGDNGTGKTSLTEAITWAITGVLPPALVERGKGSKAVRDVLVSAYGSGHGPARVRLAIVVDGQRYDIVRTGDSKSHAVSVRGPNLDEQGDDALAELSGASGSAELTSMMASTAVLRQDAIRQSITEGPATLHERMSAIIGLESITEFTAAAKEYVKVTRAALREAKSELDEAERAAARARARATESFESGVVDQRSLIENELVAQLGPTNADQLGSSRPDSLDGLVELGRRLSVLVEITEDGAARFERLARARQGDGPSSLEIDAQRREAFERESAFEALSSHSHQLAESALGLLGDGHCPVCRQAVNDADLRARLQQDLESASRDRNELELARTERKRLSGELERALRREEAITAAESEMAESRSRIDSAVRESPIRVDPSLLRPISYRLLANHLGEVRAGLRRVQANVHERVADDAEQIRSALRVADENVEQASTSDRAAKALEARAVNFADASQTCADELVRRSLSDLGPSFTEVFDRLQPHPTFSELSFRTQIHQKRNVLVPEVSDPVRNVVANPLVTFSEGQLNAVALSYFLGIALNSADSPFGFLILDDPLQSMDVISVLGFADLCRRLRYEKQLIITTHDRRWAELLIRKMLPRTPGTRTIVNELAGWTDGGPIIVSSVYVDETRGEVG